MAKERPLEIGATLDGGDDAIRCAACEHVITSAAYRCEQAGAHEHTFVNPNGFLHHIGCFTAAPGCLHVGEPQEAFSWFPGWSWQIAVCGRCRAHLGWIFRLAPGEFHGLIVNSIRM